MTDIIDKLRALGTGYVGTTRGHRATLMNEAADVIEALRAENEKLRGDVVGLEYMLEKAQERLGEI